MKRTEQVPALIDVDVIEAIKDGSIEVVPTVESFAGDKVVLVGGTRVDPHAVVMATGYQRGSLIGYLGKQSKRTTKRIKRELG